MTDTATGAAPVLRPDAVAVLTLYVVVLLAVPSVLTVGALGTAGSPATLLALAGFGWWAWFHLQRDQPFPSPQRVRGMVLVTLAAVLAAYAHGMSTPLPAEELTPADSGLLKAFALGGIALLASDGLASRDHHRRLVGRLVLAVGAVAALGVVQNLTGQLWVDRLSIPGLTGGLSEWTLSERRGLSRPSGTSTHPIEFGVVLTTVLPLAATMARRSPRNRRLHQVALVAICFAILLSISRSAVICSVVGLVVLAAGWTARARVTGLAVGLLLAAAAYVTQPGLLGTLGNLFVGAADDSSIVSRTASYDIAWEFIARSPLLGRGPGTFLPGYWILDNQYLGLAIEVGVLGLVAFVALFGCSLWAARAAAAAAVDEGDRELSRALMASVAAGAVGFAFFDTLAFPQSAGVLFLVVGLAGAALRLHAPLPATHRSAEEAAWSR